MNSAAPSTSAEEIATSRDPVTLSGPVAVCVDRPVLSLDRPFTYDLPVDLGVGVGSLVQVRFHGKLVRAWVLGPTDDLPARMLPVHKRISPVRFFDARLLELYRWMSERYIAPLATVIGRAVPPRVVSEEREVAGVDGGGLAPGSGAHPRFALTSVLETAPSGFARLPRPLREATAVRRVLSDAYANGTRLLDAVGRGSETFVVRTAPGEDAGVAVECVGAALEAGRTAVVVVPEVDPRPATVVALTEAFGDDVAWFFGGDRRARYRMWLEIAAGRYAVVVGTRPAVFAPIADLGLLYVAREHHSLHREERAPYFHVRDVAAVRAAIEGSVAVLASVMPSLGALATPHVSVEPRGRRWPPVEVVAPGVEGRAPRLVRALQRARRGFLYEPVRGYGMARVCRTCGEPAACASCGGALRSQEGLVRCTVCEVAGRCGNCGGTDFGVARGGAERVEEWARGVASVPVRRLGPRDRASAAGDAEVLVGGIDAVKDLGTAGLDLVGILNADASLRRPGVSARERALGAWAEAAAWAAPGGRVIVQTTQPNDHAVQALVAGRPDRFARVEAPRLEAAGFPVGAPVVRVAGAPGLEREIEAQPHRTLLVSELPDQTVCLVALDPGDLRAFGTAVRRLAERGVVTRVEAEPHL